MSKQRLINNYCPTILDIKGDDVEDAKEASENEDIEDEEEGEEEDELLQDTDPGPLGCDGKDVEDVLNIISQSIYREGEGISFYHSSSFIDRQLQFLSTKRTTLNQFLSNLAGQLLLKLSDRSSLLSVVSHSLSAYITTLDPIPLQR